MKERSKLPMPQIYVEDPSLANAEEVPADVVSKSRFEELQGMTAAELSEAATQALAIGEVAANQHWLLSANVLASLAVVKALEEHGEISL